jgi:hypothetical protein
MMSFKGRILCWGRLSYNVRWHKDREPITPQNRLAASFHRIAHTQRTHRAVSSTNAMYPRKSVSISRRPSSLIFSRDRFSAIIADQIERNSERDDVLEEKQAEIVHVMHAVNHDGVIRSRDQHAACGEEHAD